MNPSDHLPGRASSGSKVVPLLRAVLLADLVDSTDFLQRFGDAQAALALQRLDLQIRDLLEFTGGRLIDKADGLLALFERPVQAVDFALRYQQALRQFSSSEGSLLTARVGIHVGELMTWSNTDAAIAGGAKPLEVEGLAKPVAARLMSLALPGQILISSMAQALAHRAQAELGERAEKVRWLVHGRYRFKGVPAPLLVHEVGEAEFAPMRSPPSAAKVWRDVPIWRRPPVLAMELLLVVVAGLFYGYSALRSPPALAFQHRDWVVVGDLSNFTGDPRLEESLDTALRISLSQSRHFNIMPSLRMRDVLERMGRSPQATVDRAVGSEIALREGARALLLPSVAEVGGRLRVSIEVIDPHTQATVFAETAEGDGAESALASLDAVNDGLRMRLGESISDIAATNAPLAKATTANLDALRAYSLARTAASESRLAEALALYQQALQLDPDFAMALLGIAKIHIRNDDSALARKFALAAAEKPQRMSHREALELDTFIALFGPTSQLLPKFKLWASMYPDSFAAYYGYAYGAWTNNQSADALAFLAPALSPKNAARGNAYFLQGVILLTQNRYSDARVAFQQAESMDVAGEKLEFAETYAAERKFTLANEVLQSQTLSGMPAADLRLRVNDSIFLLDQGKWPEGVAALDKLQNLARIDAPNHARALQGSAFALQVYSGSVQPAQLRRFIASEGERVSGTDPLERMEALFPLLAAGWSAARNGDLATARKAKALAGKLAAESGEASLMGMSAILDAELALAAGQPKTAIAVLSARHDGSELYFSHALLMRAHEANQNYPAAMAEAEWLMRERGRAYGENHPQGLLTAANIVESNLSLLSAAEFAEKLGQPKLAQEKLAAFTRVWPGSDKLPFLGPRMKRLRAALEVEVPSADS